MPKWDIPADFRRDLIGFTPYFNGLLYSKTLLSYCTHFNKAGRIHCRIIDIGARPPSSSAMWLIGKTARLVPAVGKMKVKSCPDYYRRFPAG